MISGLGSGIGHWQLSTGQTDWAKPTQRPRLAYELETLACWQAKLQFSLRVDGAAHS